MCDPIVMYIFAMRDKRYRTRVCGGVETSSVNLFALSFILDIEIFTTHFRNINYDAVQEIRPGPTRPGDIIQR